MRYVRTYAIADNEWAVQDVVRGEFLCCYCNKFHPQIETFRTRRLARQAIHKYRGQEMLIGGLH